jgi:3-dehydroquinate dehydratase-2
MADSGPQGPDPAVRRVLVLHGPNLNVLGSREPHVYGSLSLEDVDERIRRHAHLLGIEVRLAQSNLEGELISLIQAAAAWADGIVLNAAGYSHTSVAILDAIRSISIPVIGVHLTNPLAREPFRHVDIVAAGCIGTISGFGWRSYTLALDALVQDDRPTTETMGVR